MFEYTIQRHYLSVFTLHLHELHFCFHMFKMYVSVFFQYFCVLNLFVM